MVDAENASIDGKWISFYLFAQYSHLDHYWNWKRIMAFLYAQRIVIFFFLLCAGAKIVLAASAEANNPFNEFMSPSGGVNAFTGDVALAQPIYALEGVNGMRVDLGLNYSGNVHLNVRADNGKAPTEWMGLGWRLGFGNIHCDHGNTGTLDDDRCVYVSPKGVAQDILKKGGAYFLSKDPFWKVVPAVATDGSRILGWTLTDINGRRFRYGDFVDAVTATPSATRYVFWWKEAAPLAVDYVGNGYSGIPKLYPWQWDLAEEIDVDGNTIKYAYEQIRAKVKQGSWLSSIDYTQASYLSQITVPGAGKFLFIARAKSEDEYLDPHGLSPEPDAFMEFLETRYLESIQVQNPDGAEIRKFKFEYVVENFQDDGAKGFSKRFLNKIVESGADAKKIGTTSFSYNNENSENPAYPLGVLKEIGMPLCGKITYDVERVSVGASRKIYPSSVLGKFEENARAVGGQLKSGEEFLVVINGKESEDKSNEIFIFNNDDGVWKEYFLKGLDPAAPDSRRLGLPNGQDVRIVTGQGFFMLVKKSGSVYRHSIFAWDGKDWTPTSVSSASKTYAAAPTVLVERDMIVIAGITSVTMTAYSYHRNQDTWIEKSIEPGTSAASVSLNGNHLLFFVPKGFGCIMTWTGAQWVKTKEVVSGDPGENFFLGNDFYFELLRPFTGNVFGADVGVEYSVRPFHWTGRSWVEVPAYLYDTEFFNFSDDDNPDVQGVGTDYVLVRSDDQDHLHLFEYTGEGWRTALNRNMVNSDWDWFEANWHGNTWTDYAVVRYPRIKWHWKWYYIVPYKELDSDARVIAFNRVRGVWKERDFGTLEAPNTPKRVVVGQDFFVHNAFPYNAQIWDGVKWLESNWDRPFKKGAMERLSPTLVGERSNGEFTLFRKFQNSLLAPVYAFAVKKKTVTDPVRGKTAEYTYDYDLSSARFDIRAGAAKFHKVTVGIPDHGSRVTWFHNGHRDATDPQSQNPESRELAGNAYRDQELNIAGKVVSEKTRYYNTFRKTASWPLECRAIQLSMLESEIRKVKSVSEILYDEMNGLPSVTTEHGSAGRKRITEALYAYKVLQYSGLGEAGAHMLSQVAEIHVYENALVNTNLASSRVATWSADANGVWHRWQSWVWNGKKDISEPYVPFIHANPISSNSKPWRLEETVSSRDGSGRVLQVDQTDGTATCQLYGRGGLQEIASVANATCAAIGVLPGDYDDPGTGFVDQANSWAQNESFLDLGESRYGAASLHVPVGGSGPSKRIAARAAGRDYTFSAWVYPIVISAASPIALAVRNAAGEILPGDATFGNLSPGSTHGWQRVERSIPSDIMGSGYVDVSVDARGGAEFRVQDIRFLPKQALASTRYLDPGQMLPLAVVPTSGSADYFQYDGASRVIKTFREDGQARKILRSTSEFHLDGCSAYHGTSGLLAKLSASAGYIPFAKTTYDYGDLWIDPLLQKATLRFAPETPGEDVEVSVDGGAWASPCCKGNRIQDVNLANPSTTVEVRAGSGKPYKVVFRKPTTCWTAMGSAISGGWADRPSAQADGSHRYAAFRNETDGGKLYAKRWDEGTGAWVSMGGAISSRAASEITLKVAAGVVYLAYIDELPYVLPDGQTMMTTQAVVKKWNGSSWLPLQGDGILSKGPVRSLGFDARGSHLWAAYIGIKGGVSQSGKTISTAILYARHWNGTAWESIGGGNTQTGVVSEGNASKATVAIHPDGTPFIGYLGQATLASGPNGQPDDLRTSVFPIVKKKLGSPGQEYWGDLVPGAGSTYGTQGEILGVPGTDKLQLSFGGTDLYLAIAYRPLIPILGEAGSYESSPNRILDVRKLRESESFADKSHWWPLTSGTTADAFAVAPLDPKGDFHFTAAGSTPALVFATTHNEDKISVIQFAGNKWQVVGNPAFLSRDAMASAGALSLAFVSGTDALIAVRQDDGSTESSRNAVRAARFSGSCPDLTLSLFEAYDGTAPIELAWGFKPFILFQEGKIRAEAVTADLRVVPSNQSGLSKIWIIAADGTAKSWSQGTGLPNRFTVPLIPGTNLIQVELVSTDAKQRLRYQVRLDRLPPAAVTGTISLDQFVTAPGFDISKPGVYTVLVPPDKVSIGFTVDISSNVQVFVDGRAIGNKERVEIDLVPGTTIIKMVLVLPDGTRREFEFRVDRGVPSAALVPLLDEVVMNPDGSFTAWFGYVNANTAERQVPLGSLNQFRYQGNTGLLMGQPSRFSPGLTSRAFSVVFDGTPLIWALDGNSVAATAEAAAAAFRVEMKDNGLGEPNISKPQLKLTNLSATAVSGFKVSLWLSRAEVPYQEIVADAYYFNPAGIQMSVSQIQANPNLMRIDLAYPAGYSLAPGSSTNADGLQIGTHFRNYYPGQWDRSNDWSWQGIGTVFTVTPFVTVYAADGRLLAGREPSFGSAPQPPSMGQSTVFSMDEVWPWEAGVAGLSPSPARKTQGAGALQIEGVGYMEIAHAPMRTTDISGETGKLRIDIYVPNGQSNPYWKGQLQLLADCPTAGANNVFIAAKELTPLPSGAFSTLEFAIPEAVLSILRGNFNDFRFKWALNVNQATEKPVLDNMRFVP